MPSTREFLDHSTLLCLKPCLQGQSEAELKGTKRRAELEVQEYKSKLLRCVGEE